MSYRDTKSLLVKPTTNPCAALTLFAARASSFLKRLLDGSDATSIMPIEIRQLVQDPTKLESYRKSLELRKLSLSRVDEALELHRKCRELWAQGKQDKSKKQQLSTELASSHKQLEACLETLPNFLQEMQHVPLLPKNSPEQKQKTCHKDTLFELGGYEEVGGRLVLTGLASNLLSAVDELVLKRWCSPTPPPSYDAMNKSTSPSWMHWKLPAELIECGDTNKDGKSLSRNKPSWRMVLDECHGSKKYTDTQLPFLYLVQQETSTITSKWKPWSDRYAHDWHILVVAGPSYEIDIQPILKQLRQDIQSLLQDDFGMADVECHQLAPDELYPDECSRLVWTIAKDSNEAARSTPFAALSYCHQYWSSSVKHRHTGERLSILHGTVCHTSRVIEAILQKGSSVGSDEVQIPQWMRSPTSKFGKTSLPIVRRRLRKKNGQYQVVHVDTSQTSNKPSPHTIRMEAASCPFKFLPFHQPKE